MPGCRRRSAPPRAPSWQRRAAAVAEPAGVRAPARHRPRHQEPHAGQSRLLPGDLRRQCREGGRHGALVQHGRGGPRRGAGDLPQGRREDGHQGQVDDLRGDQPQRPPGGHGITPVETDLGEYILQLRKEHPSHIIAPAFHLNREDWEADFRRMHTDLPADRVFAERRDILTEARTTPAREIPRRRRRHHRRQFPHRRNRQLRDRHQRGQWRPDADPAPGAHRHRQHREGGADAGGLHLPAAPAGAQRDGAGFLRLHHLQHRRAPRRRIWTGRRNTTWCCWTTAGPT